MLDEAALAAVVRSHVGPHARVSRYSRDNVTPMTIVLDTAREVVAHPFAVFWVDGGLPENYSLPSFTPAVVVFNSRYLEMAAYLRGVLTEELFSTDTLSGIAERACLEIMAELTLRYGDPAVACYLMARSLITARVHLLPPSLEDIEHTPVDEMYMAVWFFALLHELGHVHVENAGRVDSVVTDSYLDRLVDAVMAASLGDMYEPAREALSHGVGWRSLDRDVLTAEVEADLFAVDLLLTATQRIMRQVGSAGDFSVAGFVAENLLMFRLFHHMNRCARVAAVAANARPEAVGDFAGSIAMNVRLNTVVGYLAQTLAAEETAVEQIRAAFLDMARHNEERMAAFDEGFVAAQAQCLDPSQRENDVLPRLAERAADDPVVAHAVERFRRLAESLEIDSPDLQVLVEVVSRPADASAVFQEAMRAFLVAWISGPEADEPFSVEAPDGQLVVPVYFTESDVDDFVDAFGYRLAPGHSVRRVAIVSPTEHNAMLTVLQHLPESRQGRARVLFDGSPAYVRWLRSIADANR
jgi:hypothetical protein